MRERVEASADRPRKPSSSTLTSRPTARMSSLEQCNGSVPRSCSRSRASGTFFHVGRPFPVSFRLFWLLIPRSSPFRTDRQSPLTAKYFRWIFYLSSFSVLLDFLLNMIWLPIATKNTFGFNTAHEAFMTTYNGTGAPAGWNWCLSYLATAGILLGFDASGHVAEETKNAGITAARGIFWSTVVSGIGGFSVVILFLFCVVRVVLMLSSFPAVRAELTRPSSFSSLLQMSSSRSAGRSRLFRCTPPSSETAATSS